MKAPPRLFSDPHVPSGLHADLARVKRAPSAYDEQAGFLQLRAALRDLPAPPSARPVSSGSSLASRAALGWKLALIGALGGAGWWLGSQSEAPRSAVSQPVPAPARAPTPPPSAAEEPAPAVAPAQDPPVQQVEAPRSSRREIDQLIRLRALLASDPAAAYRSAQRSQREFPRGALREEREALQALALEALGDHDRARREAQQFLQRYPESPLRARVQRLAGP